MNSHLCGVAPVPRVHHAVCEREVVFADRAVVPPTLYVHGHVDEDHERHIPKTCDEGGGGAGYSADSFTYE